MSTPYMVPPVTVDFVVTRYNPETGRVDTLVSDGFTCRDVKLAAEALERAAAVLRREIGG